LWKPVRIIDAGIVAISGNTAPTTGLTDGAGSTIIVVMANKSPFALVYADELKQHLHAIDTKYHSLIQSAVENELLHEPGVETRNRKPLKRPIAFGADWELRFGPYNRFRVFYQIDAERREVRILAIGFKERSKLFIGGEEFEG
jgi:hypothetical protein